MLSGMYFPWILVKNPSTLRKALIYFDNVGIICPKNLLEIKNDIESLTQRMSLNGQEKKFFDLTKESINFLVSFMPLVKQGVIKLVDPSAIISTKEEENILYKSIYADVTDPSFYSLQSDLEVYIKGNVIIDVGPSGWTFHDFYGFSFHDLARKILSDIHAEIGDLSPRFQTMIQSFLTDNRAVGLRTEYVGHSLLLNKTIMACNKFGFVPFTDDPLHLESLYNKYNRTVYSEDYTKTKAFWDWTKRAKIREGIHAFKIIELGLPNFEALEIEEILDIREKLQEQLQHFRTQVNMLSSKIETEVLDIDFEIELENQVKKEVIPAIAELERKLKLTKDKILLRILKKMQSAKPIVPFAISVFTPLPFYAALLVSAGIITLEVAIETHIERKEIKSTNGLSYLINFKKSPRMMNRLSSM